MAIEKTIFFSTTVADAAQEVYTWLTANASDLFDSINIDTTNNIITCSKNEKKVLTLFETLTISGSFKIQHYKAYNANETALISSFALSNSAINFEAAYKTSNGIVLVANSKKESTSRQAVIFISKDENGKLIMCGMNPDNMPSSSSNGHPLLWILAPESETSVSTKILNGSTITVTQYAEGFYWETEKTSFSEVLTQNGTKAPHLFYLPFTQYPMTVAEINDGSKQYVTDGFFALEE